MGMSRMERYEDENEKVKKEEPINTLSREKKNQEMYDKVYLNTSVVDINNIIAQDEEDQKEIEEVANMTTEVYEEKSYDVNDYLKKAHEKHTGDNAMRDLENSEFREQEDEIRKLISEIEEKEQSEDIFSDLRGDNEDTLIGGKLQTDEFDTSIYDILKEDEERLKKASNTLLEKALSDETVVRMQLEEEEEADHSFEDIEDQDDERKKKRKAKKLPIIIFAISLVVLIVVILLIVFK